MQKACEKLNLAFRLKLQEEFSRRLRVNERYSIRSFANHLEIDSSTLSRILAGKKQISETKMQVLMEKIGLMWSSSKNEEDSYAQIELDTFAMISDWYHYAILDLTILKTFKSDSQWIARKIGIEPYQAKSALERLRRLGMLKKVEGKLKKAEGFYSNFTEGTTSAALKEYQRQVIKKALHAVDNCPQDRKDITSITIAADSRKLQIAKEKIKIFRRELCAFLEDGEKDSVFHLTVQLYPVTEIEN